MSVHFVLLRCRPHLIYLHSLFPVTCFTPVVLLAILLFLVGCHNEASETQVEIIVPERERIPHYDREHIVVDQSRSFQELVDPPAELVLLHNYLQNPNELTRVPLDLMFSGFVGDRKSTRLNSSHVASSYAVFCLKKKTTRTTRN